MRRISSRCSSCRFIVHLGHHAVILRCDDEPSTVALANSTRKSLRSFGVACKLEFVTVGNHQGNGAAEATVQVIRQLGLCFLQRVEAGGGLDKPTFGAHHPLTAWCLVHGYTTGMQQPLGKQPTKGPSILLIKGGYASLVRLSWPMCKAPRRGLHDG